MSAGSDGYVPDDCWTGRYLVKHAIKGVVAAGCLEACRASLRLYEAAIAARREVRTSVNIVREAKDWFYHPPREDKPLTSHFYSDRDEWERAEALSEAAAVRSRKEGNYA